jgi:RNA polymerase sigma-70 factor (sigma-E family)
MRNLGPEFDEFVVSASDSLLRTAYLLCGDRGHAEDLLQTALLRTARRWSTARENPYPYALRVIVNLSKDSWRNRGRRVAESPLTGVVDAVASPSTEDVLARRVLVDAVRRLPARQQAVLVLRYFADLSVEQTAEVLGCSTGTVKSQAHHALTKLREQLTEPLEETYADR